MRYGFKYEGLFRQHQVVKGENRDTAWYSIIDSEWPARKAAFERWLAPDNFDKRPAEGAARLAGPSVSALRRATRDDLASIVALQRAAYAKNRVILGIEPLPLTIDYAEIFPQYEFWLAEEPDGLAGVLILEPRPDDLLIWSVATAPEAQGRGIGNRMLAFAEARALSLGLHCMRLYTGEKLTGNIAWYRRRGYDHERIEDRGDRRLVHLVKQL